MAIRHTITSILEFDEEAKRKKKNKEKRTTLHKTKCKYKM